MPVAVPIPDSRQKELEGFQRRKCAGYDLKRFLCVWLRHDQGMSAVEIASSLGMSANTVRVIQRRFIVEGSGVFASYKRGPKSPRLMSFEEESAFLETIRGAAENGSVLVAVEIKAAWEERLGRPVHTATLYRMLKRHGWRKVAPRPKRPKQDKEALEAFKKGAMQEGSQKRGQKGCH